MANKKLENIKVHLKAQIKLNITSVQKTDKGLKSANTETAKLILQNQANLLLSTEIIMESQLLILAKI